MMKMDVVETGEKVFKVDTLRPEDVDSLIEVAREWVRDRNTGEVVEDELWDIRKRMLSSLQGVDLYFFVVRSENGKAIGCCAIREPEKEMQRYRSSSYTSSCEVINVFLSSNYRGKGLGYKLMLYAFDRARELGFEEAIWNSGPRYRNSAWNFYTKLAGKPVAVAEGFYGKGGDAPVWRKVLKSE